MLVALKHLAHEYDEDEPDDAPRQRARHAVVHALVEEAEASREHESCGYGV